MIKKFFLFLAILGASLLFYGCANQKGDSPLVDKNANIIFFYGSECPHCKVVEDYIKANNIIEKVDFSQAEVYHNKDNAAFLAEKAQKCGIDTKSIGVPFLWENGKCHIGQEEVIQFFKDKTK